MISSITRCKTVLWFKKKSLEMIMFALIPCFLLARLTNKFENYKMHFWHTLVLKTWKEQEISENKFSILKVLFLHFSNLMTLQQFCFSIIEIRFFPYRILNPANRQHEHRGDAGTMTCLVGKRKHTSPFVKVAFPCFPFIS